MEFFILPFGIFWSISLDFHTSLDQPIHVEMGCLFENSQISKFYYSGFIVPLKTFLFLLLSIVALCLHKDRSHDYSLALSHYKHNRLRIIILILPSPIGFLKTIKYLFSCNRSALLLSFLLELFYVYVKRACNHRSTYIYAVDVSGHFDCQEVPWLLHRCQ